MGSVVAGGEMSKRIIMMIFVMIIIAILTQSNIEGEIIHYLNQLFFIVLVRLADIHGLVLHNPYPETSIQPINLDQRRSIFQIICPNCL